MEEQVGFYRSDKDKTEFREFVDKEIIPRAQEFDETEQIPHEVFRLMSNRGILGAAIPARYGGTEMDVLTLGGLHEELGRGYGSVQNLVTVYGMVAKAISRWGSEEQKKRWLSKIANAETIVSIAITEPKVGSDIKSLETVASPDGNSFILNGKKKWITLGQIADIFLVFARINGKKGAAFLIERQTQGLEIHPIKSMLGLKANMLAEIHLEDCRIHKDNLLGRAGMGLTHVANSALDEGRYTTACGCIGLGQGCLDRCLDYAQSRQQFGVSIRKHQLIQKMITEIVVSLKAARQLCIRAGYFRESKDPGSITETLVAKYYASKMANTVANNAVQILGASGCQKGAVVERYYRDAKIMEIIEGTSQVYEIHIANSVFNRSLT